MYIYVGMGGAILPVSPCFFTYPTELIRFPTPFLWCLGYYKTHST